MGFDPKRFAKAFARHGLMGTATVTIDGSTFDIIAALYQPQSLVLGDAVVDTGYQLESDDPRFAGIKLDAPVVVDGVTYLVSQPPEADRIGLFRKAELRKQ